jgi:predicted nucleic acid binding AN1-type Zn finger protein
MRAATELKEQPGSRLMTTPHSGASPLLSSITAPSLQIMTLNSSGATAAGNASSDKSKKSRCEHSDCRAKLGLLGFDCKCTGKYCAKHRYPDQHDCAYNFRAAAEATLKKQLVNCTGDKMGGDRV